MRPVHLLVLGAILLLALGLRVKGIDAEGLWIDELYSLEFSGGYGFPTPALLPRDVVIESPPILTSLDGAPPLTTIWTSLGNDIHPPLYYVVLRIWREMFGSSDAAIRSLSVIASLVAIMLLFDVARLLFGPSAALWAALLMALAQPQVWYAQEARGYMMATALSLGATSALLRIERSGITASRALALGSCLLLSVLTHYGAVTTAIALGLYALVRLRGGLRWRVIAIMGCSAALFLLLWGPFLVQQPRGASFASPIFHEQSSDTVRPLLNRLIALPMSFFSRPPVSTQNAAALAWLLLLLPIALIRRRPNLLVGTLWAGLWIGIPLVMDLTRHMRLLEYPRYVLGAAPGVYLIVVGLLNDQGKLLRHLLPAGFAAYCAISLPWVYAQHKGESELLGADAATRIRSGDLILFTTPTVGQWYAPILYLNVTHYASHLRCPIVLLTKPAGPDVLTRIVAAPNAFVVCDAQADLDAMLPGVQLSDRKFAFPTGCIWRVKVPAERSD